MPVVVTGADGPLGAAVLAAFLAGADRVELRATVRDRGAVGALVAAGVRTAVSDLEDPTRFGAVLEGAHTVVHLDDPLATWDFLLDAAEDTGLVRVVTVLDPSARAPDAPGYDLVVLRHRDGRTARPGVAGGGPRGRRAPVRLIPDSRDEYGAAWKRVPPARARRRPDGGVRTSRGRRWGRDDPAGPAEDERAERGHAGGAPGGGPRRGRGRRDPGGRDLRRRAGLRGRRGRQGDGRHDLRRDGGTVRPAAVLVHGGRAHPEAGHRRDHGLRARRRLRARDVRRLPGLRRRRATRPARDRPRHHPRRRRDAAAAPPRRAREGQGADLLRPLRRRAGVARDRPRRPRRPGRRRSTRAH